MYAPSEYKPNLNYRIGSYGHLYTRLNEVKSVKNVDILFLGSSHAYRGFDTRIFKTNGYSSFNLGSSSQTPVQALILCKRYLEQLNPKLIIYEVYPIIFEIDGIESSLDLIANDKNDLYSLEMSFKLNNIKTYNTFLYGIIRDFFKLNNSFKEPIKKDNDTYISGGYVQTDIIPFDPTPELNDDMIEINKIQIASFEKLLKYLDSKNTDVILVYAPVSTSLYSNYVNNSYFDSIMNSYSEYYNFNEILDLNDTLHFLDSHHLNQKGVDVFNEKLIEILKRN